MKFYLLICLLFLSVFSFSQVNQVDAKGKKQGVWEKTYPNSKAYEYRGQFKDDKPTGIFYHFYPSTKKKAIVEHNDKTGRSKAIMYHENGLVLAEGIYINQKKDSIWTTFGPSGKLSTKESYKAGVLHGQRVVYYIPEIIEDKSQKVAMVENYVNGIKNGDQIEYFEDGTIKSKFKYENGKKVGKGVTNHINGKPMMVENYKNGKLHGYVYAYDQAGKELGKKYYKNGDHLYGKELDKWLKNCKDKNIDPNK
jgi:antitoxin component YwqK of YwqJK toxin-antitoxin module